NPDSENRVRLQFNVSDGLGQVEGLFDARRATLDHYGRLRVSTTAGDNLVEMDAFNATGKRARLVAIANNNAGGTIHMSHGQFSGFALWETELTISSGAILPLTFEHHSSEAEQPGIARVDTQSDAAS